MIKEGLVYTPEHEWVEVEGEIATVGITDHAQEQLGEITFVELPQVGQEVAAHEALGAVESSKAASDVYAPTAGKIIEANSNLETQPELINKDCYTTGWICKLRITDAQGVAGLMKAREYQEYLKEL